MQRAFGPWTATAMVVGTMIGAGIFVMPASLAPFGWTALAAWLLSGVGVLALGQLIAVLSMRFPDEPSILTICGDILGLGAGRVLAWSYWVGLVPISAVLSTVAAEYLLYLVPGPVPQSATSIIALAVLASVGWINLAGIRGSGHFQVITTILKLLPLVLVIVIVLVLAVTAPGTYTHSSASRSGQTG
ncbi:amino acid permease [Erythrobacter sp. NE805]|uniref:amino acid permease n=1 Tax=Erythrobacter sp. NE805 TaxID=3389875 RepID=UPI00396AF51F